MSARRVCCLAVTFVVLTTGVAWPSSIVPPLNLGELAQRSEHIVLARAGTAAAVSRGELLFTRTTFAVEQDLRGALPPGATIAIETPGGETGNAAWIVAGSPRFSPGSRYLLFLDGSAAGAMRPAMLSYGILREQPGRAGVRLLAPLPEAAQLRPFPRHDGQLPEEIGIYREDALIGLVGRILRGEAGWDARQALATSADIPLQVAVAAPPAGCSFMNSGGQNIRWDVFDTGGSVSIYASAAPDPSISGGGYAQVEGAVDDWMAVASTSLNLSYGGALSYSMTCTSGQDTPGSGVNIVMFNDPCNDISNLSSCTGVLGFGGPWFGDTHTFDGSTWYSIASWFVVLNNGVGCLGATDYQLVLAHELGHGLGFDHVSDPNALMYAYCCNAINSTDTTCAQYLYPRMITDLPEAPTNLQANAVAYNQVLLSWTDNASGDSNESSVVVERRLLPDGTFAQVGIAAANATQYTDTEVAESTSYGYRVKAVNAIGESAYSNEATTTTPLGPPSAPSSLTATAVSSSAIDLAWTDNAGSETGFKIERRTGAWGTYTEIATVGAGATTFQSTGLTASTSYTYRVRATNAAGDSAYSNTASATTLSSSGDVPTAPSSLTAAAASSSAINLAWTDNSSNETGFKVERKTGTWGTYSQIATVGAGVTSYQSTGLAASTAYTFRVRATNAAGNSSYSNTATATTLSSSGSAPAAPSGLSATAASSSAINLAWTDNSSNETGFKIERKTGSGSYSQIATVGANVTSYQSTGLAASTTYTFRVRASNAAGNSSYSNEASATTQSGSGGVPAAPSSLTATAASSSAIDLAWTDNSSNETGFKIERKTGTWGSYSQIATVGAGVTSYQSTGLAASTAYTFRVRATNAAGNSSYSNTATATTLSSSGSAPAAPSGLSATAASSSAIDLAWTDNSSNETGFKIERKTGSGSYSQIATVGAGVTSYQSTGLAASTAYTYRVRASNAAGNSTYSNEASATTEAGSGGGLAAPSSLTATAISSSAINLAWTDTSSGETGFKIERKKGTLGSWAQVATVGANVTSYADTGLASGTSYSYRVRASDGSSDSAYSNTASATTKIVWGGGL